MRLAFLIAAVSAAVLGYEVALMRALSVARWHHFAYMVVSVALLGFGASGTFLALWRRPLVRRFEGSATALATAFAIAIPASFAVAQRVPFDVFQLVWDWRQSLYLLEYYLVIFVPFFLGAACIGLAFVREAERIHRLYFWNLLGSGVGAGGIVGLMFLLPPAKLPLALFAVAGLGVVAYAIRAPWRVAAVAAALAAALVVFTVLWPLELQISQHKRLSYLLEQPQSRVVAERPGPLGVVHVVDCPAIHFTDFVAGLSAAYVPSHGEPKVRALLVDADSPSGIYHLTHPAQAGAFDHTTSALAYHLLQRPRTLVVGAGGGGDVVLACHHRCRAITALELNPTVVSLMRGGQAKFSQRIYRRPDVTVKPEEARGFLARTAGRYDLIQLPLVESFGAASAGVYALHESTLYTVEAVESYLDHLASGGLVSITRWLRTPPSDALRLFATVTEALRRRGVADPGRHLVFIRGWATATLLVGATPLGGPQAEAARRFCEERCFDLTWAPGIDLREVRTFNPLERPYYAEAVAKLLSPQRDAFIGAYALDIAPTTDDRPYHSLTFRWRAWRHLRATMGEQWVRYVDWGYLVLVATVAQAAVAGLVLVVVPLFFARHRRGARGGRLATCVYFACLGLAYMFIEIVMIQKLSLFLASPIYSAAVVLGSFMVFSGLGSLSAGRIGSGERGAATAGVVGLLVVGLGLWLGMDALLGRLAGSAWAARVVVAMACAGGLAFFMGMPFPSGLRRVARQLPALTPWAWGINGCASVAGAALAMLLAVSVGFRAVLLAAYGLYAIAALALGGVAHAPIQANDAVSE